jgi:HAD superfamily hydrolase (TIGR01493 family)
MIGNDVGAGQSPGGRPALETIDAVTVDAYGTLLTLNDPVARLARLLPGHSAEQIERAFAAEGEHYVARSHEGRDRESLARLRAECVAVFNEAAGASLSVDEYLGALEFEPVPGAFAAMERLAELGLGTAVVANWDCTLPERLPSAWTVVTSAEAGAPKPDPAPFRLALARLGVQPDRALHVGDSPADKEGARAAGMSFAPAPLAGMVEGWA